MPKRLSRFKPDPFTPYSSTGNNEHIFMFICNLFTYRTISRISAIVKQKCCIYEQSFVNWVSDYRCTLFLRDRQGGTTAPCWAGCQKSNDDHIYRYHTLCHLRAPAHGYKRRSRRKSGLPTNTKCQGLFAGNELFYCGPVRLGGSKDIFFIFSSISLN